MNKTKRFLSSILCALLLTSSLAATNVFADETKTSTSAPVLSSRSSCEDVVFLNHTSVYNICVFLKYGFSKSQFKTFLIDNKIMTKYDALTYYEDIYDMGWFSFNKADENENGVILKYCDGEFTISAV